MKQKEQVVARPVLSVYKKLIFGNFKTYFLRIDLDYFS